MIFHKTKLHTVFFLFSFITSEASLIVTDVSNKPVAVKGTPYFMVPYEKESLYLTLKNDQFSFEKDKASKSLFWFSEMAQKTGYALIGGPRTVANSNAKNCLVKYCKTHPTGPLVIETVF